MADNKSTAGVSEIVAEFGAIHSTITALRNELQADEGEEAQDAVALLQHAVVDQLNEQIERLRSLSGAESAA